jgi:hypothetical protein
MLRQHTPLLQAVCGCRLEVSHCGSTSLEDQCDFHTPCLYPSLERHDLEYEYIANAAHRLDEVRHIHANLNFAPEPPHLEIDASIEDIFLYSSGVQQILPRERPPGCFKKGKQQLRS